MAVRFLPGAQFITWSENSPARLRAVRRRGWAKSESVLQANVNSVGGQNETETDLSRNCRFVPTVGTNLQLRDKSVSVSFCPPTEFTFACKTDSDFAHPLL